MTNLQPIDRNTLLSRANTQAFTTLYDLLHSQTSNLLAIMADRVVALNPNFAEMIRRLGYSQDIIWRAEEYRRLMTEDRYFELLRSVFSPPIPNPYDECIKKLVGLNFRHFLTTNYDKVLEMAHFHQKNEPANSIDWTNHSDVREFLYQATSSNYERRYVYLHGRYNDPARTVLTDRDYTDRYLSNSDSVGKLSALFSTFTVVFFGFSLSDPALMQLIRQVKLSMVAGAPRHYAILALNSATEDEMLERNRLSGKFGIEPVFYPLDSKHEGLCDLIRALSDLPDATGKAPSPPVIVRPTGPSDPDDPQKGMWGGSSVRDGYQLTASVDRMRSGSEGNTSEKQSSLERQGQRLYRITLKVTNSSAFNETLRFHLHPSFTPPVRDVQLTNGAATLELVAIGAFTVGVEVVGKPTKLELDLASDEVNAPSRFREH